MKSSAQWREQLVTISTFVLLSFFAPWALLGPFPYLTSSKRNIFALNHWPKRVGLPPVERPVQLAHLSSEKVNCTNLQPKLGKRCVEWIEKTMADLSNPVSKNNRSAPRCCTLTPQVRLKSTTAFGVLLIWQKQGPTLLLSALLVLGLFAPSSNVEIIIFHYYLVTMSIQLISHPLTYRNNQKDLIFLLNAMEERSEDSGWCYRNSKKLSKLELYPVSIPAVTSRVGFQWMQK